MTLLRLPIHLAAVILPLLVAPQNSTAAEDVLVADFESADYGKWKTSGEAFGAAPARGALPGQMDVTGFLGQRLVNSFHKGDGTTGTLTSPPLAIERAFINFLIGGGKHPETCINLLVGGMIVRTASGPNDAPGGSEQLGWHSWDVADLVGKEAVIQVIDKHTGGWGHINVDHIVQSDKPRGELPVRRELLVERPFLRLPVKTGAPKRRMQLLAGQEVLREFEIELADGSSRSWPPGFWAFVDVSRHKGKKLTLAVNALPIESRALEAISQADTAVEPAAIYREKLRPQFHFTSRVGWHNDPNGMVYSDGEWHLYYQHNPFGWNWGNMHWGHAVSKDLVHWQELPTAIYPHKFGDWAFSGSAVVDQQNTSGFKSGAGELLVGFYTSTGRGECVVYSNDRGRTWTEFEGNPVVRHQGRDPKVVWHPGAKHWSMAVYDEHEGKQWIAFYSSPDLKAWKFESRIEGFFECPDLFEAPVQGSQESRWILYAADGKYVVGEFDGRTMRPSSGKHQVWWGNFYAAQTFENAPQGRRIQVGWGQNIVFPDMPFNQQMTVPCELTLRRTDEGVRMFAEPVKELDALHGRKHAWRDLSLEPATAALKSVRGELLDIRAELDVAKADSLGLAIRGVPVRYDAKAQRVVCEKVSAPLAPIGGRVKLRILADRGSIEVFGNSGRVALSIGVLPSPGKPPLEAVGKGDGRFTSLEVAEVRSAWKTPAGE